MPSLGADISLEQCLAEGRQAGYAGFELGHKFPRKEAQLRPLLEGHGLALVSGWYSARLLQRSVADEVAALQDHLVLLRAFSSNVMVFAEVTRCIHGDQGVPLSRRPELNAQEWASFGSKLTEVADAMQGQGMRMAYHHHMGTVVQTEADIDQLMAHTGENVGLLLDTGHLVFSGGDPLAVIDRHGSRIAHVHCKDLRFPVLQNCLQRDSGFLDAVLEGVFTVPGDGDIDFAPVLGALAKKQYSGWLVVEAEQDPAVAHPLTYASKGYATLSSLCDRVGLSHELQGEGIKQ